MLDEARGGSRSTHLEGRLICLSPSFIQYGSCAERIRLHGNDRIGARAEAAGSGRGAINLR
jgi:hypothetical protein